MSMHNRRLFVAAGNLLARDVECVRYRSLDSRHESLLKGRGGVHSSMG
jgi:hypothetical protein